MSKNKTAQVRTMLLVSTRFFQVESDLENAVEPIVFSNNLNILNHYFSDSNLVRNFGTLRLNMTFGQSSFGHKEFTFVNNDPTRELQDELMIFSKILVGSLNGFFNALWFIKDCSCHLNHYLMHFPETGGGMFIENPETFSSASSIKETTLFTHEEIKQAFEIHKKCQELIGGNAETKITDLPENDLSVLPAVLNMRAYNKSNRLERAMMFLNYARKSDVIMMKIAMYVPLLEALFSLTNETEISHKISERSAVFIGQDKDEKREIYTGIKKAYDVRSKLLHGAILTDDNIDKLTSVCNSTDEIVRRILTKVIMIDNSILKLKGSDLEVYFRDLLFA